MYSSYDLFRTWVSYTHLVLDETTLGGELCLGTQELHVGNVL